MGQATEEERNRLSSQTQPAEPVQAAPDASDAPVCLLGSDHQPAVFVDPEGNEVQLGEVVRSAFEASGVADGHAWNDLSSEAREQHIQDVIDNCDLSPLDVETAESEGQTDDNEGENTEEAPAEENTFSSPEEDFEPNENAENL